MMEIIQACEFAPMFIICEESVWFPCNEDFIANEMVKDESGFDVKTVHGTNFYHLKWLMSRGWFSFEFLQTFTQWAAENDIPTTGVIDSIDMTWVVKEGDSPEFIRTIGFASDGEAYVALRSVDLPKGGLEAKTTVYRGERFISVHDFAKASPAEFSKMILADFLPALAKQHDCKCNAFG